MLNTKIAPIKLMKNYKEMYSKVQNCIVLTISSSNGQGMNEE